MQQLDGAAEGGAVFQGGCLAAVLTKFVIQIQHPGPFKNPIRGYGVNISVNVKFIRIAV
jgi:hypothetical protein